MHTAVDVFRESKDPAAFRYVYDSLSSKLYYVCLRYLKNEADAQDVLQETFITAYRKIDSYSGNGSFEGWVRRIAVNNCLGKLKVDKQHFVETTDLSGIAVAEDDQQFADREETEARLLKALHTLPTGYRTILNLAILEDYSHKEIGEMLGISESTSRSQLARARVALKEKLEQS